LGGTTGNGNGGFKFQYVINYVFDLSDENHTQNWSNMMTILLQKLLNHGNEASIKVLFELFEVITKKLLNYHFYKFFFSFF
jgi:hypothetical protein